MPESLFTPRYAAGIWMFGQFIDRYATDGYGPERTMLEALKLASQVPQIEAVDLNYPFWSAHMKIDDIEEALQATGLRALAVTPAIYTRQFAKGAFTNPDPGCRGQALALVNEAAELVERLKADYVKLWPGQDGWDYPLQADHGDLWKLAVDGVRAVALEHPDVRFAIEYKPKEPRTHIAFGNAARTLLGLEEIGLDNVGILIDIGHSLYGGETPADAADLVLSRNKLFGIDFNDNLRSWDDDLTVGSVHIIETIEFLLTLRRHNWSGYWQLDQFPFREDPVQAAKASLRMLSSLNMLVQEVDLDLLHEAQQRQDALAAQAIVHDLLLRSFEATPPR